MTATELIVRRDGPTVLNDWTVRLAANAAAAAMIKAKSFTIDGDAVVPGPDACHEELSRRGVARIAIHCAFDLIEHDGEDLRNLPFLPEGCAGVAHARY
jgi:ATP-dependent DNA ligase